MAGFRRSYFVREKQLRALASAARQEIIDVMAPMGAVSVAEIAATLGRPADALYYHLRALERAGLVLPAGHRRRGGRQEALFRAISSEVALRYQPRRSRNREGVNAIVSAMLRLGTRDFRRAFSRGDVVVSGPRRELWALRRTGWLSPAQVAQVNRFIRRLSQSVNQPRGAGRLYGITVLLTPLDRARRRQAKTISKRKRT